MCGFLSVQGIHSATNVVWRLAYWGSTPHSTAQVKLITAWPQTTALGLPHGWELVNQVGVVALFVGRSSQWASYFGVPVVLLTMSFRAYAQVLPTVKRIGIILRSEPATEAKKNLGRNFTQRAQESALIPDVRTLQQIINQNTRYSSRTQNHFYINRRPLRGGNLLWESSIQNNFMVPSLASTHTYILKIGTNTMGQNHGPI